MLFLLFACTKSPDTDSGPIDTDRETDDSPIETDGPDTDVVPTDVDDDGYFTPEDCDDLDPRVHPGVDETWNGEDDDCDGVADADGDYAGSVEVVASAVYEGDPYRFEMDCPTVLHRESRSFSFTVTCTSDASVQNERLLLGETLTIVQVQNQATDGEWSGTTKVESSDGWDADATGTLSWTGFDQVELTARMRAAFLDLDGTGDLGRQ